MTKQSVDTTTMVDCCFSPFVPGLLVLAIAQALTTQFAEAANIEVTSTLDDGTDCTLRESLATINSGIDQLNGCLLTGDALGTNDTITFGPAVAGQTITTTQGELQVARDVSINPGGINTTIDADQGSRVINVISDEVSDMTVSINQLTITGGNSASDGGGISVSESSQYYVYSTVSLFLTNSTVSGNTAGRDGGGIFIDTDFDDFAIVELTNSTVTGNSAGFDGGGIHFSGDYSEFGSVNLTNSTVSNNSASPFRGGGVSGYLGGFNLTNSTVSGNTGDGIFVQKSNVYLRNSTVTANMDAGVLDDYSSFIYLENSIIANNYGTENCYTYGYNGYFSSGPDSISNTVCGGATVADPLLGPLADNGGPTQTHALLPGSPAINNATAAGATATDQRGVGAEGVRDSGAYEFIAAHNAITIDKLINNEPRESVVDSAQLLAGSLYRQVYEVTNTSSDRLYQVRVFEGANQVCNMYTLDPGETKQSCSTVQTVLEGDQHVEVVVNAKVSGTSDSVSSSTDAYYTGILNGQGQMDVTHYVANRNADTAGDAQALGSTQTNVLFKVENTGDIELYRIKTYHDPVSPVNSGWSQQCVIGPLKPGQVRYCKRDISLSETGLNHAMGRAQGVNAFSSPPAVINAANPTYFIVP